jgi:hypothetical protein
MIEAGANPEDVKGQMRHSRISDNVGHLGAVRARVAASRYRENWCHWFARDSGGATVSASCAFFSLPAVDRPTLGWRQA